MADASLKDLKSRKFYVALLAEFLGTLLLVLVGCGSTQGTGTDAKVVRIALCFALCIATIVWATANVSGGHLNPAVTLGFLVTRKISIVRAILYIVVQVLGAIVGAALLKAVSPDKANLGATNITAIKGQAILSTGQGFGIELLITFVLVLTVFATCDDLRRDLHGSGPLAIGLSIGMCHLWAVPMTGAGMNPARSLGPAVITQNFKDHWIYWVGPIIGGILAAIIYDFLLAVNATHMKVKGFFTKDYDNGHYGPNGRIIVSTDEEMR